MNFTRLNNRYWVYFASSNDTNFKKNPYRDFWNLFVQWSSYWHETYYIEAYHGETKMGGTRSVPPIDPRMGKSLALKNKSSRFRCYEPWWWMEISCYPPLPYPTNHYGTHTMAYWCRLGRSRGEHIDGVQKETGSCYFSCNWQCLQILLRRWVCR